MTAPYVVHGKYACFFQGPLSQWYQSDFRDGDLTFCCCEQAMMWRKAELFGDQESMRKIMATKNPREHKKLGRMVKGFDAGVWANHNRDIILRNNILKFEASEYLRDILFGSENLVFVEASPWDTIYGIGRGLDWPHLADETTWRGDNLLGFVLTETRDYLRQKMPQSQWVREQSGILSGWHRMNPS